MDNIANEQARAAGFARFYLVLLGVISALSNWVVFGVYPLNVALPSNHMLTLFATSAVLLYINHLWLMIATELTRARYQIQTTPEEWAEGFVSREDIPQSGWDALTRVRNAHRNLTENSVHFAMLSVPLLLMSPSQSSGIWLVVFALGRLGYTFAYLRKNDILRGLFMTVSMLALLGVATYLPLAIMLWAS